MADELKAKDIKKKVQKGVSLRTRLHMLKEQWRAKKKQRAQKKAEKKTQRQFFTYYLKKSGSRKSFADIKRLMTIISIWLTTIAMVSLFLHSTFTKSLNAIYIILLLVVGTPVAFFTSFIITAVCILIYLDVRIYRRRVDIEEVLPDFLQLAAANIHSGMTVDRALWFAIRPQFGVLANEMELVAKQTMSGEPLDQALIQFGDKYDSPTLRRSLHLIVEGINAGGELGELLDRIAVNLQDAKALQKEMAANVTSYVMFISFATVIAAPFMYGLAYQLVNITTTIIASQGLAGHGASMGFSVGGGGIETGDFIIYAITNIIITSISAVCIISTIKKGNVKSGLKNIPLYAGVAVVMFVVSIYAFNQMLGGFF